MKVNRVEIFLERAKQKHNNKYDYSKVKYVNNYEITNRKYQMTSPMQLAFCGGLSFFVCHQQILQSFPILSFAICKMSIFIIVKAAFFHRYLYIL